MGPGVLTAISLICVVLTVEVPITAPQLESTVSVSAGELIRFAGWRGPCGDQAGSRNGPPVSRPSSGAQFRRSCPAQHSPQSSSSLPSLQSSCPSQR